MICDAANDALSKSGPDWALRSTTATKFSLKVSRHVAMKSRQLNRKIRTWASSGNSFNFLANSWPQTRSVYGSMPGARYDEPRSCGKANVVLEPSYGQLDYYAPILLALLMVVFAMRLVKTKKFMPSGLMLLLTLAALALRQIHS